MGDISDRLLESLLDLHRERDPQGVLRRLAEHVDRMTARAVICCYLTDRPGGSLRLELLDDTHGAITSRRWRPEFHAPPTFIPLQALPDQSMLPRCGGAVTVAEELPRVLGAIWPAETTMMLYQALEPRFSVVAPVCVPGGLVGLLMVFVAGDCSVDAAAACTAHAAVALGGIVERRAAQPSQQRFMRGVIEHVALREIRRAEGAGRQLSLVVVEVQEDDPSPERLVDCAGSLVDALRQPDLMGYLDRRRIVMVLPDTPAAGATAFLRRLPREPDDRGPSFRAGCATFPQDGRWWDDLVQAAVARLHDPLPAPAPRSAWGGTALSRSAPPAGPGSALEPARPSFDRVPDGWQARPWADRPLPTETQPAASSPHPARRAGERDVPPLTAPDALSERAARETVPSPTGLSEARHGLNGWHATVAAEADGPVRRVDIPAENALREHGDPAKRPSHGTPAITAPLDAVEPSILDEQAATATVLLRVAPLGEDDIPGWQSVIERLPAVVSVAPGPYDGYTAGYEVGTHSVARLMAQLNQLGAKVAAVVTPTISGEINLTLRSAQRPAAAAS